jgi:hypothetical protein
VSRIQPSSTIELCERYEIQGSYVFYF